MNYMDDQTIGAYQAETTESLRAPASRLLVAGPRVENSGADLRIKNQMVGWTFSTRMSLFALLRMPLGSIL